MSKRKADCTPEEWEKHLAYHKKWRENHPQKSISVADMTEEEHKKRLAYQREWRKKHRKTKKDYTKEEWEEFLSSRRLSALPDDAKERRREYFRNREKVRPKRIRKLTNSQRERRLERERERKNNMTEEQKEKLREQQRKWKKEQYKKHKNIILERGKKYQNRTKNLFIKYAHKLTIDEDPIADADGYMLVRDFHTKEYFYPKLRAILNRIASLEGRAVGENHMYSSNESKEQCPIYRQKVKPKSFKQKRIVDKARDPAWRSMVLARAEGHCERCGKECDSLIAHHKVPVASCAMMAADIDNGMALCPECHREVHSTDGCRLHELAAEKRKTA
jgi:hypothetical protein